ncbi:DUF6216 family protein [Erwinia billingiae]|uniref:DUF6216 family protein n=1 Tax=Erwinia billingiae TaxID=182337 RepID=UPI00069D6538|nr:DUF6216 family protein [Erwinia billingiae]
MENELNINAILNAPWLLALLPSFLTFAVTAIRKLNAPLNEDTDYYRACGIPPLLLRLSLSRGKLKESNAYSKKVNILIMSLALIMFCGAGWLTFQASKAYHESPPGWALLKLTSTNEHFLISLDEATSPDKKSWVISPKKCALQTYDTIASDLKISNNLVFKLCNILTLKSQEKEIKEWITKVHNGAFKLIIFFIPIILMLYWFAIALLLDAMLKLTIDKYNKQQAERAKQYLT